jgi:hypothetical protein
MLKRVAEYVATLPKDSPLLRRLEAVRIDLSKTLHVSLFDHGRFEPPRCIVPSELEGETDAERLQAYLAIPSCACRDAGSCAMHEVEDPATWFERWVADVEGEAAGP